MEISCPRCGFSREVGDTDIPPGPLQATCPQCRESFSFRREEVASAADGEPALSQEETPSPAAPGSAPPPLPAGPDTLPKAGFWIRAVAAIIDSFLVSLLEFVCSLLLALAAGLVGGSLNQQGQAMMAIVTGLFAAVIAVFYYVFFTGYGGQTPGKMALRIKVIRTDGSAVSYGRAFLREVPGKFLSGILLGIGYLMVAFDRQKQGLHDKIANTYVIKL